MEHQTKPDGISGFFDKGNARQSNEDDVSKVTHEQLLPSTKGFDIEDIRKWYEEYSTMDGNDLSQDAAILQELETDKLDSESIEKRIRESAREIHTTTEGFCPPCQKLFANWPELVQAGEEPNWQHTVGRTCHTIELEAATRGGCRFCAFLMQRLRDTELLVTFRKIEARIDHLNETGTSSLSIKVWGQREKRGMLLLWLNLPGRVCDRCVALRTNFVSSVMPPSGT